MPQHLRPVSPNGCIHHDARDRLDATSILRAAGFFRLNHVDWRHPVDGRTGTVTYDSRGWRASYQPATGGVRPERGFRLHLVA